MADLSRRLWILGLTVILINSAVFSSPGSSEEFRDFNPCDFLREFGVSTAWNNLHFAQILTFPEDPWLYNREKTVALLKHQRFFVYFDVYHSPFL